MSSTGASSFADRVISFLDRAKAEVESLQLQTALGRMEAADQFEKLKSEFRDLVEEGMRVVDRSRDFVGHRAEGILSAMDGLRVQLHLGRAEVQDVYREQKRKIMEAATMIEKLIDWEELPNPASGRPFRHDLERLKLNLELLRLHYELKKLDKEDEWRKGVAGVIDHWKEKVDTHRDEWDRRSEKVFGELQSAYDHLRKALQQI